MEKNQEIYINLDDSGKLTENEKISVFGGIIFLTKKEKDKFITQYKSIINDIKCNYCKNKIKCNKNCPEIKNTNIKPKDKRRIINYIKKYNTSAVIIKNEKVYNYIKTNKSARGRFNDYAIRRMIKNVIVELIKNQKIDPFSSIKIIINIDEQSTKSNGYYNLKDGLIEELKYGISNYNYASHEIKPIIYGKLNIELSYKNSSKSYVVQAADLIAGTTRQKALIDMSKININLNDFIDYITILP